MFLMEVMCSGSNTENLKIAFKHNVPDRAAPQGKLQQIFKTR